MHLRDLVGLLALALTTSAASCSDHETHEGSSGTGGSGHTAQHGSGGAGGGGGVGAAGGNGTGGMGGDSGPPQAPNMVSAEPLDGGLHVMWDNVTMDCSAIEIDRKKDQGAYALAFTLTGAAYEQHDSDATAPGEYCYRGRCKKGAEISPDSNEVCGTP